MNAWVQSPIKRKRVILGVKIIACVFITAWLLGNLFTDGIDRYISQEVSVYQNELGNGRPVVDANCIEQVFYAQSSVLSNVILYLDDLAESEVTIQILDASREILTQKTINMRDFTAHGWNRISVDCYHLKKGERYIISLKGENLIGISLTESNLYPEIFANCTIDQVKAEETLAVGLQFTDWYMLMGNGLELAVNILYFLIIASALLFTVFHFEDIFDVFIKAQKKKGFFLAIYFSVYTVLFFNPLDSERTAVDEFRRMIGQGLNRGVDVSKRISNFNQWFFCLAILFSLFYLLANYLKTKILTGEEKKAMDLLDQVVIIANVTLGLRCITYFYDKSSGAEIFYYSSFCINMIIFLLISYMALHLGNKISLEKIEALLVSEWSLALPLAVVITHDWTEGKVLMGLQVIVSVFTVLGVKFLKIDWNQVWVSGGVTTGAVCFSLIPFCTSFYIEFVTLLNQHGIFWNHLRRNYFGAVVFGLLAAAIFAIVLIKREKRIENWKSFSYPALVLGFSCLYAQIPISSIYSADIMETANFSILISDFLYYGKIPIVQHYGGHMMQSVWEGLIYALLNNDYVGAVFSPYAGYQVAVIALAFYILMKYVWDEDSALLTVLFFPFYGSIWYWGMGIIMVLAVMAYVKKNTYVRAILFWLSFVWCVLYRLDLGTAFGLACMAALFIYVIVDKNWLALKQLARTLAGWGIIGGVLWFGICFVKGINPLNRLLQFLMISLSNQNWAYTNIGDMTKASFAWAYLFLPFIVAICMLYSIFSGRIREKLGNGMWMANLVLGFSFFFNYSRGLVRHSLVENQLNFTWSAYLFLAVFMAAVLNQRQALLPTYAILIVLGSLLLSADNYFQRPIADVAAEKIGSYTETWTRGRFTGTGESELYWSQLKRDRQIINRVEWDENLAELTEDYRIMLDTLLEDDETFVDCSNRTMLYSLLGRQNPIYLSQSPAQLSGEFTQEEFVKEMQGIPIVLMPYVLDSDSDGILNAYRYYKVFEYIYMNYVPLCTYENIYTIWCQKETYDDMVSKIKDLRGTVRYIRGSALLSEELILGSGELTENTDDSVNMNADGEKCELSELQNIFDLTPYMDKVMAVEVEYEAEDSTEIQLFYTTELDEDYTEDKVLIYPLDQESVTAYFKVPVTQYTRLRIAVPEGDSVKIKSFTTSSCNCQLLAYENDGEYRLADDGQYAGYLLDEHDSCNLKKLPLIWGEKDRKKSTNNDVLAVLEYEEGVYRYALSPTDYGAAGNYLKVSMDYAGWDQPGKTDTDDETFNATIRLGKIVDGQFETKYSYSFVAEEGHHDYMFRISSDYFWYLGETNAVILQSESSVPVYNIKMAILEGD